MPFTYDPRTFPSGVLALVWGLNESACELFESSFFFVPCPIVFLDISPLVFKAKYFGLISSVQDLRVGVPDIELESLAQNTFVILPNTVSSQLFFFFPY